MFLQIAAIALVSVSPAVSTTNSAVSVSAMPEAPIAVAQLRVEKKHNFNKLDYALYSGVVAYRLGDYFTTEKALANGQHEQELPQIFVANKAGFMTYSLGMAALEIAGSVYLHKHGHAKIARFADAISIGAGTYTDVHNYMSPNRK
jgi:hypothetical protein